MGGVLWKRMSDKSGSNWRVVYKSLDLLMHIIKFGHDRVSEDVRDHQMVLRPLIDFTYFDPETGNDRGRGIRTLTKQIMELLKDGQALRKLREEAAVQRQKLMGINSTSVSNTGGYGGGGYGSNSSYGGGGSSNSYREDNDKWKYDSKGGYDAYGGSKKNDDSEKDKKKKRKKKKKKKKESSSEAEDSDDSSAERRKKRKKKKKKKKKQRESSSEESAQSTDDSEAESRKRKKKKGKKGTKQNPV